MIRTRLPRIFELIDLIDDRCDPNAYFREFESRLPQSKNRERAWTARESEFAALDPEAWGKLKLAARPHLVKKPTDPRGWTQLISTLNEARGYIYLKEKGCLAPAFIPKSKRKGIETPDLKGERDGVEPMLCEVKTLNISDDEVAARGTIRARSTETNLSPQFLKKLQKTIAKAFSQLVNYEPEVKHDRVALIIPNFDEFLGEYKCEYYAQIDEFLESIDTNLCRVAMFNSRTAFDNSVEMRFAEVINE